jgi:N-acetylglucosamine kinase-like BadF-type ATPase
MTAYFLGADLGGTKTHCMVSDENGRVIGFSESGPGNHESVGYDGFQSNLHQAVNSALKTAGLSKEQISGSGFGVAGYDWPIEREPTLRVINTLKLGGALDVVNDTDLGLLAGSPRRWGVAVVSGTGCNCRGWDAGHTRYGMVSGGGITFGEHAGAGELMFKVCNVLGAAWRGNGPATALADAFCQKFGVATLDELIQGAMCQQFDFSPADAPLVFEVARQGDAVAIDLIKWAGKELGELACSVIRQLQFENVDFDLVQIGGMWSGSPMLTETFKEHVLPLAPKANILRSHQPPVLGAVLLGFLAAGLNPGADLREHLIQSMPKAPLKGE